MAFTTATIQTHLESFATALGAKDWSAANIAVSLYEIAYRAVYPIRSMGDDGGNVQYRDPGDLRKVLDDARSMDGELTDAIGELLMAEPTEMFS